MANDKKTNLTIVIDEETRNELFRLIPSGEVSKFVYRLIKKELDRIKKEIAFEYQQAADDQELIAQLKKWNILNLDKKNGKKIKPPYIVGRGRVFCLEPESKNEELNMVLVISNELHNQFANHIIVALVTDKNVEQVRPSLEIACRLESKKLKVLISHFHTINKENFYRLGHYIGKLDEKTMKKINEHIKSVLDLDN